jgi:5,6-dimethylbenzimidazole synthase
MQMNEIIDGAALTPEQLLALMRQRRTTRTAYVEDKPVTDTQIELLLEAARSAPSAGNAQPWEFVVVRERDTRYRIVDLFKQQLRDKIEIERAVRGTTAVGASLGWRFAPVQILVIGDPRTCASFPLRTREEKAESHFIGSLANATLQMMLMAECLGLATQYVSDASSPYFSLMLKHLLGIPAELRVYHLVPVGYVSVRAEENGRRPLEAMVHRERYDPAKQRSNDDVERFVRESSVQSKGYRWGSSR